MCLADFATIYRHKEGPTKDAQVGYEDDVEEDEDVDNTSGTEIHLKNNLGTMRKRKTRAILRSPRFSSVKSPDRYHHALLMLYYPWRKKNEDLKGSKETYQEFLETVIEIVKQNQQSGKEQRVQDQNGGDRRQRDHRPVCDVEVISTGWVIYI